MRPIIIRSISMTGTSWAVHQGIQKVCRRTYYGWQPGQDLELAGPRHLLCTAHQVCIIRKVLSAFRIATKGRGLWAYVPRVSHSGTRLSREKLMDVGPCFGL